MNAAEQEHRLAELRAELVVERATPDRNACYARAIEREIERVERARITPPKDDA